MKLDGIHWVDINAPVKKEYTFKNLNSESSHPEPNKDDEPRNLEKEGVFWENALRGQGLICEGTAPTGNSNILSQSWEQFKKNARSTGRMLGIKEEFLDEKLVRMENVFQQIGGEAENGYKKFNQFIQIVDQKTEGLKPKLEVQAIFDKISENPENNNDYMAFFNYICNPKSQLTLNEILQEAEGTLGQAFFNKLKKPTAEAVIRCFDAITGMSNFKKNGTDIGKGEIAVALFFKDCKLASDEGDIDMSGGKYEIKGDSGSITARLPTGKFPQGMFNGLNTKDVANFTDIPIPPKDLKKWIPTKMPKSIDDVDEILKNISGMDDTGKVIGWNNKDTTASDKDSMWKRVLKFRVLFSWAFCNYPQQYNLIIGLNTSKNSRDLFTTPLLKIPGPSSYSENWYDIGCKTLKLLADKNISVGFHTISGKSEITFKIFFLVDKTKKNK